MPTTTAVRPALMRLLQSPRALVPPPTFLAPSFQNATQISPFSTSSANSFPRDNNRERGVSTVRRTGPKQPLSLSREPLPKPVLDPARRSKVVVDEDHGLWQFFHSKDKPMNTPEEDAAHGRPWCVEELRHKSWEDLHGLWWECCKERNRIATESKERQCLRAGYGDSEASARDRAVRMTMRGIKQALTERYYSWEEAKKLAAHDPEMNVRDGYTPQNFVEDDFADEEMGEEAQETFEEGENSAKAQI